MRIAKIPAEIVEAKVLESLRSRMDPVTRRVYPRWKQMMREIGVCRQRIADAVKSLKEQGAFTAGTEERRRGKYTLSVYYYEFPPATDAAVEHGAPTVAGDDNARVVKAGERKIK